MHPLFGKSRALSEHNLSFPKSFGTANWDNLEPAGRLCLDCPDLLCSAYISNHLDLTSSIRPRSDHHRIVSAINEALRSVYWEGD